MTSGWQSLGHRNRNLLHYLQIVMVFFIWPNIWTAQTKTLLVSTQWCWWACTHWRRRDEGMDWELCSAAQCQVWVAKWQAPQGDPNCQSWPLPVRLQPSLIRKALSKMECGKSADPSGIIDEMLKAADEEGVELVRQLVDAVFSSSEIPADWKESFILNLYKGKGRALNHGNYHNFKLTDQIMELLEWVLDFYIHRMVSIDKMQCGFVPDKRYHWRHLHCLPAAGAVHHCQQTALLCLCWSWHQTKPSIVCQERSWSGPRGA